MSTQEPLAATNAASPALVARPASLPATDSDHHTASQLTTPTRTQPDTTNSRQDQTSDKDTYISTGSLSNNNNDNDNASGNTTEKPLPHFGPTSARLNRFKVSLRILQIIIIIWLLSGISLWLTTFICIIINMVYSSFNALAVIDLWSPIYGVGVFVMAAVTVARGLSRTFMRMVMLVWRVRGGAVDGVSEEGRFFGSFYKAARWIVAWWVGRHVGKDGRPSPVPDVEMETELDARMASYVSVYDVGKDGGSVVMHQHAMSSSEVVVGSDAIQHLRAASSQSTLNPSVSPSAVLLEIPVDPVIDDMEETLARKTDKIGNALYIIVLAIVLGTPIMTISLLYGYWIVLSYITMGASVAAALVLAATNLLKRCTRAISVLHSYSTVPNMIHTHGITPTAYLRASYIATMGYDDGRDLVRKISELGIGLSFWSTLLTLVFMSVSNNTWFLVFNAMLFAACVVIRIPTVLAKFRPYVSTTYKTTIDHRVYYTGVHAWPAVTLFLARLVFVTLGFFSLVYYDSEYDMGVVVQGNLSNPKWSLIVAFVCVTVAKDLVFLVPVFGCGGGGGDRHCHGGASHTRRVEHLSMEMRLRAILLTVSIITMMILAMASCIIVGGYASSLALFSAYLAVDGRHPRCAWTMHNSAYWGKHVGERAKRRGMMNTRNTIRVIGAVVLIGLMVGIIAGSGKTLPFAKLGRSDASAPTSPSASAIGSSNITRGLELMLPPVCSIRVRGLSVTDYAAMAAGAYNKDTTAVPKQWTSDTYPSLVGFTVGIFGPADLTGQSFFVEYRAPAPSNVSVLAIRGTNSFSDIFQDIFLYSTPVLLQWSSYAGTFVDIWPVEVVAGLVWVISSVGRNQFSLTYWTSVAARVDELSRQGRDVVVTGHSLGGAVAGIVGASRGVPAIGFSAPGLGYQTVTYGFDLQSLSAHFLNIVPNHDVVPSFDLQYGFIQDIYCDKSEPLSCHSLLLTQDTLKRMCFLK